MTNDDRDLYEIFAAARREEEAHVPPLSILLPTAHEQSPRRLSGTLAAAATCLGTAIAAAVWLLPGDRVSHEAANGERAQTADSITSWHPATDFLLDNPGRELLEGVPEIGEWQGAVNVRGPGESHQPRKNQIFP